MTGVDVNRQPLAVDCAGRCFLRPEKVNKKVFLIAQSLETESGSPPMGCVSGAGLPRGKARLFR